MGVLELSRGAALAWLYGRSCHFVARRSGIDAREYEREVAEGGRERVARVILLNLPSLVAVAGAAGLTFLWLGHGERGLLGTVTSWLFLVLLSLPVAFMVVLALWPRLAARGPVPSPLRHPAILGVPETAIIVGAVLIGTTAMIAFNH